MVAFDFDAVLQACALGDQTAFEALYAHEAATMRALALAMLDDEALADCVLRETFILIWRNATGFRAGIGTARAWMYSILRHRARHHQAARAQAASNTASAHAAGGSATAPACEAGILSILPAAQREALVQAYLHGDEVERIANATQRSESDIQVSIDDALRQIDAAIHA